MEKFSKLLTALSEQTRRGLIAWQATANDEIFQYSLPDSTIRIEHRRGHYYISILNDEGRIADYVADDELDKEVLRGESHFELMRSLFGLARRTALKSERTLDGILAQLGVGA